MLRSRLRGPILRSHSIPLPQRLPVYDRELLTHQRVQIRPLIQQMEAVFPRQENITGMGGPRQKGTLRRFPKGCDALKSTRKSVSSVPATDAGGYARATNLRRRRAQQLTRSDDRGGASRTPSAQQRPDYARAVPPHAAQDCCGPAPCVASPDENTPDKRTESVANVPRSE
jgi:hypothetical protein